MVHVHVCVAGCVMAVASMYIHCTYTSTYTYTCTVKPLSLDIYAPGLCLDGFMVSTASSETYFVV